MNKKNDYKYIAYIFCVCIFAFVILNFVKKDCEFSEQENRMLAQKPKLTVESIASGTFMKQYEAYQTDQFIGRNLWMKIKTGTQFLMGKRESNGVWNGKKNTLLECIAADHGENVEKNIKAIQKFSNQNKEIEQYFLLAPNAGYIWKERIPTFYAANDQKKSIQNVKKQLPEHLIWIDAVKALEEYKNEEIYYHTDHHWTSHGAYYTFLEAKETMKLDSQFDEKIQPYAVTETFNGTLSSKSGYDTKMKEHIYVWLPNETGTEVIVQNMETGKKKTTLYDSSKLKGKDKYAVFLGGNAGALDILTTSKSNRRLLILKDSYANCFIPFLVPYYREIIVVDPRYYYDDLQKMVGEKQIDTILFLYNANTFFGDNSLNGVLCPES